MTEFFNQDKFEQFQQSYNEAVKNNQTEFTFNNKKYLVTFAAYLIQYLENNYE